MCDLASLWDGVRILGQHDGQVRNIKRGTGMEDKCPEPLWV